MDAGLSSRTEPSGAPALAVSTAMRPPAPGRLSMMMVEAYPRIWSTSSRAVTSDDPPGAKPTIMRVSLPTTWLCARRGAAIEAPAPAAAATNRRRLSMISSGRLMAGRG